jgi:uncharacterized protein (TIGR00251 family)
LKLEINLMLIRIKVQAKAKKDNVILQTKDKLLVQTKEPAKQGRANRRVHLLLANYFHVSPKKVKLIRGGTQPNKLFEIYGDYHQED